MSNQPSNPISVNSIVDTNVDLKCIPIPECRTLPNDVQAIVDAFCASKYDNTKIVKNCLNSVGGDINTMLNILISYICTLPTTIPTTTTTYVTGVNYCDSDLWNIGDSPCIDIEDSCGNPVTNVTELDIIRMLIKRVISLQNIVTSLKAVNDSQQTLINTNMANISNILANCCSITILSQIQTINNRLNSAGIP
jgi:hypothetical protein